jgi:DNA excision repair protein ERCC-2
MAKAIQSAGRVIRTETDRGLIVLFDDRFLAPEYSSSMPNDWFESSPHELVSKEILKDLSRFWSAEAHLANGGDEIKLSETILKTNGSIMG